MHSLVHGSRAASRHWGTYLALAFALAIAMFAFAQSSAFADEHEDNPERAAVYRDGTFFLNDEVGAGDAPIEFDFGQPGDTALFCDITGDGETTPVVVRDDGDDLLWDFRLSNDPDEGDSVEVTAGAAGTDPVCGDWNGDGTDGVGFAADVDGGLELNLFDIADLDALVDGDVAAGLDAIDPFIFGRAGDRPLVGNWDGEGGDGIGAIRPDPTTANTSWRMFLKDDPSAGDAEQDVAYGREGDKPVVGDWNADGSDTPGVKRGNEWLLRSEAGGGNADLAHAFGTAGDAPLAWRGPLPSSVTANAPISGGATLAGAE